MYICSNTAMSLDGRIASYRHDHVVIGTRTDQQYMSVLRARCDAVLVGGATFRNWPLPLVPDPRALEALASSGFPDAEVPPLEGRTWWNVVWTRGLDVPKQGRFYQDPRVRPLFFSGVPGDVPAEVVVGVPDLRGVVAELERRGVQRLLIEGGGELIYQLLEQDLLDELYVTICPALLGGRDAPSLVGGRGFEAATMRRLSLGHLHRFGDELYARYTVDKRG